MADEVQILTEAEITTLPPWAQVAFAIRCARRVQPLFAAMLPDAPAEHDAIIDKGLRCAEWQYAADGVGAVPIGTEVPQALHAAAEVAHRAPAARAAAEAAFGAFAAAGHDAAARGEYATDIDPAVRTAEYAAAAAFATTRAATIAETVGAAVLKALRRDFEALRTMSTKEHWTDETRPSLESLAPLWLEGEEPDWNEVAKRARRPRDRGQAADGREERLVISAHVDESVDDDALVEGITELYRTLNKYHILCGGSGLTIDDWRILAQAGSRDGVLA